MAHQTRFCVDPLISAFQRIKHFLIRWRDFAPAYLTRNDNDSLAGNPVAAVSRMAVGDNDELFVLDAFSRKIKVFSSQGQYERQLGQNGQAPGEYITPTDVEIADSNIVVDDFTVHRINQYSGQGSLARSFVYTAQTFGSGRLGYFPKTRQYVLFGNKWLAPTNFSADRSAELVNIYDRDGRY